MNELTYIEDCKIGATNIFESLLCGQTWQQTQIIKIALILIVIIFILFIIFLIRKLKLIFKIILIIVIILLIYFALGKIGVILTYQCGTTLGPNGPVNWCGWYKGQVVG